MVRMCCLFSLLKQTTKADNTQNYSLPPRHPIPGNSTPPPPPSLSLSLSLSQSLSQKKHARTLKSPHTRTRTHTHVRGPERAYTRVSYGHIICVILAFEILLIILRMEIAIEKYERRNPILLEMHPSLATKIKKHKLQVCLTYTEVQA